MSKLYISYGANTNVNVMADRCPAASLLGVMTLRDYHLVFRGCADMVRAPGRTADVGVWEITDECEAALDKHESSGTRYVKRLVDLTVNGERRTAMIYVMKKELKARGRQAPHEAYEAALREGYEAIGLPTTRIDVAKQAAIDWCERHEEFSIRFISRVWEPVMGELGVLTTDPVVEDELTEVEA